MSSRILNPPELYRFAWGYFAERLRDDAPMRELGDVIGKSQSGYNYIEKGNSTNSDIWMEIFEYHRVDFTTMMTHARVIVRAIQHEEESTGKTLTRKERVKLANRLYVDMPF